MSTLIVSLAVLESFVGLDYWLIDCLNSHGDDQIDEENFDPLTLAKV
jgi:hypothetical protein